MAHADGGSLARRIVSLSRVVAGLAVTISVVASCANRDHHPPFASCALPDAAAMRADAGPDAGDAAIVGCGTPTRVIVGGATPPGGRPPPSGAAGDTSLGNAGAGAGVGGSAGVGVGGNGTGIGAGGTFSGFGGTGTGFGGTDTGFGGSLIGLPGMAGFPF